MSELLTVQNLSKNYGSKQALRNVSLSVSRGRIVGLLGPNGSGKTTMLKLINGLLRPSAGQVMIDGQVPGVKTKPLISYLPDKSYLNDWMTVSQLIEFFAGFYADFSREKAAEMLKSLQIDGGERLKALSKGTKEKVQLILVMARNAPLYLLDEPIGGVDPAARDYILDTILSNYNENASILFSTHLIADVEKIFDDVIFINQGEIVLADSVDHIRQEHNKSVDELFREVFKC